MGAEIQYRVTFRDVGPIFDKVLPADGTRIELVRETGESKYTATIELEDILDNILSELDFDNIASYRSEPGAELELLNQYNEEQISNYDEFNGDFSEYIEYLGQKILTDLIEYADEIGDAPVRVETWL